MRRLALIFGIISTLATGGWGSALASALCPHDESMPAAASGEHDCCRANLGDANAHRASAANDSHEATQANPAHAHHVAPHARVERNGEESARESNRTAVGERGLSCLECCAGRSVPAPTVAVSPEQNRTNRDAANQPTPAPRLFTNAPLDVSRIAPTQHAPPATEHRRHVLLSVFLI